MVLATTGYRMLGHAVGPIAPPEGPELIQHIAQQLQREAELPILSTGADRKRRPQGGNTRTTGGSVPTHAPGVLQLWLSPAARTCPSPQPSQVARPEAVAPGHPCGGVCSTVPCCSIGLYVTGTCPVVAKL